jgi:serine/threonine protein kinase
MMTGVDVILGTAAYMSPEQAQGQPMDARTDIFSFGAVLYEMLTGERAFTGESTAAVLGAILRDEPRLLSRISPGWNTVVRRCLEKDPAYPSSTVPVRWIWKMSMRSRSGISG